MGRFGLLNSSSKLVKACEWSLKFFSSRMSLTDVCMLAKVPKAPMLGLESV